MQNNRIDSRARGNAPQMLDKYKKLANDAAMNDDRVQTEYYLQFADHYFRVIADAKAQKDEQRAKREGDREQDASDDGEDDREQNRKPRRNTRSRDKDEDGPVQGAEGDDGDQSDEDNPFTRETAKAKPKPARKPRAPRKKAGSADAVDNDGSLDPDMLPPSIARASDDEAAADADAPKPAKGLRPRRRPRDDDGEALEAVG